MSFVLQVSDLCPNTRYALKVAAVNVAGQGLFSPHSVIRTPAAPPSPPQQVHYSSTTSSLQLTWLPAHDNGEDVLHYVVAVLNSEISIQTNGPELRYSIEDLDPNTNYR